LEKEKPSILGMIRRGGQVVLRMLPNDKQATIKPIITGVVALGSLLYTDKYHIYARIAASRRKSCRTISASSSSFTTSVKEASTYSAPLIGALVRSCRITTPKHRMSHSGMRKGRVFFSEEKNQKTFVSPQAERYWPWP
jgi:hypothetical protein